MSSAETKGVGLGHGPISLSPLGGDLLDLGPKERCFIEYVRHPNDPLRAARLRQMSPSGSGRSLSRQELADMVNEYLAAQGGRNAVLDATYIGKLERGEHRWPQRAYRVAFRAVLRAARDSDLGFFIVRRQPQHAGSAEAAP